MVEDANTLVKLIAGRNQFCSNVTEWRARLHTARTSRAFPHSSPAVDLEICKTLHSYDHNIVYGKFVLSEKKTIFIENFSFVCSILIEYLKRPKWLNRGWKNVFDNFSILKANKIDKDVKLIVTSIKDNVILIGKWTQIAIKKLNPCYL